MTEPDLFNVRRKKPKQKATTPPGVLQRIFAIYREAYQKRVGEQPMILKSDGALIKRLVSVYGADKVEGRLRAFMALGDSFVVDSGYALAVFYRQWNRWAARAAPEPRGRGPMNAEQTEAYVRRMRGEK